MLPSACPAELGTGILCRVLDFCRVLELGKNGMYRVQNLCRVPGARHSALGKEFVCRVPVVWHSANNKALGIYAVSGSASMVLPFGSDPLIHSNLESRTVRLAKDALNVLSLASMLGLVQCTVVLPCISLPSCRPNAGISSDANFSFSVTKNNR